MTPETTNKLPEITTDDLHAEDGAPVGFLVPGDRLAKVRTTVDRLNRRLQRAGADDSTRFELTAEPVLFRSTDGQITRTNKVTVNRPVVHVGHWQFGATVTTTDGHEESPVMITGPEETAASLAGHTVTDPTYCQHCHVTRARKKTYLLINTTTGDILQVGSTCLTPFLGVNITGVLRWAETDIDELITEDLDGERFSASGDDTVAVREVIEAALAVSEGGRLYVSRQAAADYGSTPTGERITGELVGLARGESEARELVAAHAPAERVCEVVDYARTLEGESDYAQNVRTLAAGERVLSRYITILGSVVASWHRSKTLPPAKAAEGHAAEVGTRFKDHPLSVTVKRIRYYETQWGTTALIVMRDQHEHEIIWRTGTGGDNLEPGQQITLTGGTVKDHDTYQGTSQTVITRAKYATS